MVRKPVKAFTVSEMVVVFLLQWLLMLVVVVVVSLCGS